MTPRDILCRYWGYDDFRPLQADIIDSVLAGHDTLGLLPTGGGKSITFQVPALMLDGLTIVVTPLISLMKDQVDNLRARDIHAVCLFMGMTRREQQLAYDRCRLGKTKLLYVSPERLRSERFLDEMRRWQVSLIVVDEAHCISQWGYDFRPSYLRIAELRHRLGADIPVLALTASATGRVRDDIIGRLEFRDGYNVFAKSFDRDNLSYIVRHAASKTDKLLDVLTNTQGSAIVYVRSRVKTKRYADMLQQAGISALHYHAGLDAEDKAERQERWKSGDVRVMVATNAFGMGIDKPDVRTVVHVDLPPTLEEYYQEAGRAGRDGLPAFAVLITAPSDKGVLTRRLDEAFPPLDFIRRVYELAGNFTNIPVGEGYNQVCEFDTSKFCHIYGLAERPAVGALRILTAAGAFEYIDEGPARSRIMILSRRDELYGLDLADITERVLTAVLRLYTGLFTEYVYISESQIARAAGLSDENTVYEQLLLLARMHVLHYVPRKATPYLYWTSRRELPRHVVIPDSVYADRRRLMAERLEAVRRFAFDDSRCRSQSLLAYFGEEDTPPCGRCDVCRALAKNEKLKIENRKSSDHSAPDFEAAVMRLAAHGITIDELANALRMPRADLIDRLRPMLDSGLITIDPSHPRHRTLILKTQS